MGAISRLAVGVVGALSMGTSVGCGLSDPHPASDAGVANDAPTTPRRLLDVEGETSITLAPLAERTLRFRVSQEGGGPVADALVTFALDGLPRSSTLRQLGGTTDATGIASVVLVAGPEATTFRLRATTQGAAPAVVDVSVGTEFGELAVTLEPEVTRNVRSYLVRAVADVPCAEVPSSPTGDERTLGIELATTTFPALSTSASWTIEARGQTAAGTTVARGCVEGLRVSPTAPASARVVVRDLPLDTTGAYGVTWSLEASSLGERARSATLTAAVGDTGAEMLLDGLRGSLAATSLGEIDALDRARAASLDARLAEALRTTDTTLATTLAPLADEVDAGFGALALASTLRPASMPAISPFSVQLGADAVGAPIEPIAGSLTMAVGRDALLLTGLDVPLAPASLWIAGFRARASARSSEGLVGVIREGASCGTLVTFLTREAVLSCDARCVREGCAQAAALLDARLEDLAASRDGAASHLRVDAMLDTHDDDDDLRADRLEGDATATWESSDGAESTPLASSWSGLRDDTLE